MSKYSEIGRGLNEVIGRLLVPARRDSMVREAMERLTEITIKFDELCEESEADNECSDTNNN